MLIPLPMRVSESCLGWPPLSRRSIRSRLGPPIFEGVITIGTSFRASQADWGLVCTQCTALETDSKDVTPAAGCQHGYRFPLAAKYIIPTFV